MRYTQGRNGIQTITPDIIPDNGTYQIIYEGYPTTTLAYDATSSEIQAALEATNSIGSGNVIVSGDATSSITIEFINDLENTYRTFPQFNDASLRQGSTQVNLITTETQR